MMNAFYLLRTATNPCNLMTLCQQTLRQSFASITKADNQYMHFVSVKMTV
jgi:hypothetical protein